MTPPSGLRGLVLDADGTLWNTRRAMEHAGLAGMQAVWPNLDLERARAAATRFRGDPLGAFRRFAAGEVDFTTMRALRLHDVAEAFSLPWQQGRLGTFEAAYTPVFEASLRPYADSAPLLRWCAQRGIPVRVLTNAGQVNTQVKIVTTGLDSLDGAVCSRDCLGVGKPDPAAYRHVCARLALDPGEVLFVGDEWTCDALGAARAGLASAWLVRAEGDPAAEVAATPERLAAARQHGIPVISTLDAVPALLGVAAGGPRPR